MSRVAITNLSIAKSQRGAVGVISVFLLATIVTLSLMFTLRVSTTGISDSINQSANVAALFLAESGIEYATEQLTTGAVTCGSIPTTARAVGRGTFAIDSSFTTDYDGITALASGQCRVQVTGSVTEIDSDVKRTLQSIVSTSAGSGVIASDNVETRTRNNSSSASWNHRITGTDPFLIVAISMGTISESVTSITYAGVALTKAAEQNQSGSPDVRVELWYLAAPATGNNSVNVTLTGNARFVASSASFTGVDQVTPIEDTDTGTDAAPTVQVTTTSNNAWVVDVLAQERSTPTPSVGAGQTQLWSNSSGGSASQRVYGAGSSEGPVSPVGAVTMSWSFGMGRNWAAAAVAIKPGTPGSAGVLSWRESVQ